MCAHLIRPEWGFSSPLDSTKRPPAQKARSPKSTVSPMRIRRCDRQACPDKSVKAYKQYVQTAASPERSATGAEKTKSESTARTVIQSTNTSRELGPRSTSMELD